MLDAKAHASLRFSLIVFLASLLVGWLVMTRPGLGTHLIRLTLLAGLCVLAIYAFSRTRQSFDRYPRFARVGYFTVLLVWAVLYLTISSAYRHQEGGPMLCGGYPHLFVCDSNASSPTDSWGRIDGADLIERTLVQR